jgi:hypothetical protein
LRFLFLLGVLASLSGCGSVFDPPPYNPRKTLSVVFTSATDAGPKLKALADGYADERDTMMREQLFFDVPMIGLGIAAVVNPLFHGVKDVTLGLSLGAATAAGGRLYFAPVTKVAAYNTAAKTLYCAWGAAAAIAASDATDGPQAKDSITTLTADIRTAEPSVSKDAKLMAARDQAVKSVAAEQAALARLTGAPSTLSTFASAVIAAADTAVMSGVQNSSKWVDAVTAVAPAGGVKPAVAPAAAPVTPPTIDAATLQDEANAADAITLRINAVMDAAKACGT